MAKPSEKRKYLNAAAIEMRKEQSAGSRISNSLVGQLCGGIVVHQVNEK